MPLRRVPADLRDLRARPRRLLAVFSHPDDESYGCAGTFARLARDPEAATVLLCLTRGEASSVERARGLGPEQVGDLREGRLREVARLAGLDGLVVAGLPDGRLARLDLDRVARPVEEVLEAFAPTVVVAHDARGVNGHADHIASHWAVRRALASRPGVRLALLAYTPETCEQARPRLLFPTPPSEVDVELHLDEAEVDVKEACLRVHEALVTLRPDGDPDRARRPAVERYDLLGEDHDPVLTDLFAGLEDVPARALR